MFRTRMICCLAFALLVGIASVVTLSDARAQAQNWPNRPVTIVVPFGPGAITDQAARMLAQLLQKKFNQPFVVENRPGAGSIVGSRFVSKSAPDGYTLMVTAHSVASLNLGTKNEFNPQNELTPVTRVVYQPQAMLVPTSIGVNNVKEFVDFVKANPDKAFFGLTDLGGGSHLRFEQFFRLVGIKMKPIVYQSGAQIIADTTQARLLVNFLSVSTGLSMVNAGLLKVIAYTGDGVTESSPKAPNIKTQGVDFEWISWTGFFAPPRMEPVLLKKISDAVNDVMKEPEYVALLDRSGATRSQTTPEQFSAQIKGDRELAFKLMEETGIRPTE